MLVMYGEQDSCSTYLSFSLPVGKGFITLVINFTAAEGRHCTGHMSSLLLRNCQKWFSFLVYILREI